MSSTVDKTVPELEAEISSLTTQFNELRLAGQPLDEVKQGLSELKKALAIAKGVAGKPKEKKEKKEGAAAGESKAEGKEGKKDGKLEEKKRLLLKTAKGTRDYGPAESFCRAHIARTIQNCFTTFGGAELDTPIFERKEILTDKYGEDAKLIFDLQDQGGEQLALRYDHTVPLARWLAMNGGQSVGGQTKLYQIGKVYRRDNPVMSKGRMREFMQADIDIVGVWDSMIPDAEILSLLSTILTKLEVGEFTIKVNHRKILDGIFAVCGVPTDKIRAISSAVDKLDKLPWAEVKLEMTAEKGLSEPVADLIGEYVKLTGEPSQLLKTLEADKRLTANKSAVEGIQDMGTLVRLLRAYGVLDNVLFDMSLARGLDYYTGIIYEAIVEASAPPGFKVEPSVPPPQTPSTSSASASQVPPTPKTATAADGEEKEIDDSTVGVGSIAAGGRYDNLVSSLLLSSSGLSPTSKEGKKLLPPNGGNPCVGVSIGMDRIFALLWPKWLSEEGAGSGRVKETMVFVMSAGDGLLEERIGLVKELRDAGIKTDFLAKAKPKPAAQFAAGEKDQVPFAVILGTEELANGLVTVKEQKWEWVEGKKVKVQNADRGVQVKRSELVEWIKGSDVWKEWA